MLKTLTTALLAGLVTLVITGIIYPFAVTGVASVIFPSQASGGWVTDQQGKVVGSELIGQAFKAPGYFQSRPSAAGGGYDATSSGGSNLGPASQKLHDRVKADAERLRAENPDAREDIPAELVATSGSGLDPHLSPEAARWQVPRIAKARGVASERVDALMASNIEGRTLGFLGEARINVLRLNLALDRQFGKLP